VCGPAKVPQSVHTVLSPIAGFYERLSLVGGCACRNLDSAGVVTRLVATTSAYEVKAVVRRTSERVPRVMEAEMSQMLANDTVESRISKSNRHSIAAAVSREARALEFCSPAGAMLSLMGGTTTEQDVNACLDSEQKARDQLVKDLATYSSVPLWTSASAPRP
jgi:hypothetical protein